MRHLKQIGCDCQIFITTHSTNFLDTAEMRNVYLAHRNGPTQIESLTPATAEASIPRELGIRLSSLFMFDRLVFVEGKTDEGVLREFASIVGINLAQQNVGFVQMGGVRNFAHFAAEQTMSFLSKRRVGLWFMLDRDERTDSDVEKLKQTLGGIGVKRLNSTTSCRAPRACSVFGRSAWSEFDFRDRCVPRRSRGLKEGHEA